MNSPQTEISPASPTSDTAITPWSPATQKARKFGRRSARLLVVDDDKSWIATIGLSLRQAGYHLHVARDGAQGLEIISKSPPDLILSDIEMPGMDGLEFCRTLKSRPEYRNIPLIFVSGNKETDQLVSGLKAGAVDYLFKPFNHLELLTRVDVHLALRESQLRLADVTEKVSRYVSPHVFEAIFSGRQNALPETSRKQLTVYFSDIVGFTERTEAMGDRDLTPWLNGYCDQMAQICQRHGGTLDKFIGDAVLIFFGDPVSAGTRDDAIRCLRMAIDMNQAAEEWDVEMRTGIHTGHCSVGNFGSAQQLNYTVIGKVVNTAARLQDASKPGRILISEDTHRLVSEEFWCEKRGPVKVKGIGNEIMTYWLNA